MSIKEILKAFFYKNQIEQRNQESNTEDLALFLAKGKAANGEILYGYINIKGEFVIEPQFVEARGFVNEVAVVCTANNKWGYIDKKGKYIIKPQFVYASDFYNELTVVRSANNKCGVIDKKGKYVINPQFESLTVAGSSDCVGFYLPR